jgi:hypothetical protein
MTRLAPAALAVAFLVTSAAGAADVRYGVFIDGRPLDSSTPSGLLHRGVVFINLVRAVKTFDGLLTFLPGGMTRVTISSRTLDFRNGSRTAYAGTVAVALPGAPFVENGDTYVPLATIASLASAQLSTDAKHHRALLTSPVPPPPTATPRPGGTP